MINLIIVTARLGVHVDLYSYVMINVVMINFNDEVISGLRSFVIGVSVMVDLRMMGDYFVIIFWGRLTFFKCEGCKCGFFMLKGGLIMWLKGFGLWDLY